MSNFCIVCVTRSGSYYPMEYICRTFDLAEGNEWFGRNKEADLSNPFELKQKRLQKIKCFPYVNLPRLSICTIK